MYETVQDSFTEEGFQKQFDSSAAQGESLLIHFKVVGAGDWSLLVGDGFFRLVEGLQGKPDATLSFLAEDYLHILNGRVTLQAAYMAGMVGISGDLPAILKLQRLFPANKEGENA